MIALDTNLLLLLVVGLTDRNLIGKHRRTKAYEAADYDMLISLLGRHDTIVVTPHVLTETDNLLGQASGNIAAKLRTTLSNLLEENVAEEFEDAVELASHDAFQRLGLADCGLLVSLSPSVGLLTSDLDLYLEAQRESREVVNFSHIQGERMIGT